MNKIVILFSVLLLLITNVAVANEENVSSEVNMVAAVTCLERTIALYADASYEQAMFQAELGRGYAPKMADFLYLKALCANLLDEPAKYCLDYLNIAFEKGMMWHRFNVEDASLLRASLSVNTKQYAQALRIVSSLPFEMSDAALIKAKALYGLNRRKEAEDVILQALDRHSFDSRFPKLFLVQEKDRRQTTYSKSIANRILENLYVWKDNEPILLPLSVHFEDDEKINRRNLKIYREMHTHFLPSYTTQELFFAGDTILSNINYGVLSDEASIRELFSLKVMLRDFSTGKKIIQNAIYKEHLLQLAKIVGNQGARDLIKSLLLNYSGVLLDDENKDGIVESTLYYKAGRPDVVLFDRDQNGYPAFVVQCNFGIPKSVLIGDEMNTLIYDEYPFVSSFQAQDEFFQIRPRVLKWQPFTLERLKLMLFSDSEKHKSFFVLTLNLNIKEMNEASLKHVAAYKEIKKEDEKIRTFYDRGEIISLETRVDNEVVSLVNYKNGIPSIEKNDIDRDGYFEKLQEFDKYGNIKKISIDFNKDGVFEYNESYLANGSVRKEWVDASLSDAHLTTDVVYTLLPSSDEIVEWVHPLTGKLVSLRFSDGEPRTVETLGVKIPVLHETTSPIYWFKSIPHFAGSIVGVLEEEFNNSSSPIFSCIVEVAGGSVFAFKVGGRIFAEFVGEQWK
ncbi:MAG: hypothetical protein ACTTJ6_05295 [Treponema sp.]